MDEQLPEYVRDTLDNLFLLLGSIVTICVVIPWMILPIIPLAVIYGYIYNLYVVLCMRSYWAVVLPERHCGGSFVLMFLLFCVIDSGTRTTGTPRQRVKLSESSQLHDHPFSITLSRRFKVCRRSGHLATRVFGQQSTTTALMSTSAPSEFLLHHMRSFAARQGLKMTCSDLVVRFHFSL